MNLYKKLTVATLISNLLIIVGFGHGIAPQVLFEAIVPFNFHDLVLSFSFNYNYENNLFSSAIFSAVGQIALFGSIYFSTNSLKILSLILLWTGFVYLTHNILRGDAGSFLGFYSGIPFLVLSVILFICLSKTRLQILKQSDLK
jgi:hypothetical protein